MSARRVDKRIRTAFDRLFGLPSTSPSVAMPRTGSDESDDHAGSLVRALIQARFGDTVAADGFLVDGLTAAVQARAEGGRSRARAHTAALRSRAEDLPLRVALGCRRVTAHPAAARSFIGYLLESYGPVALREFVDNYDPERLDHSARRAYHLSLADLEQQWLSWLSRQQTSHNGWRAFLLRLAPLLRPYWFTQLEIFSYMVIGILCGLAVPLASKYLVDTVIPGSDYHVLILFGVGLLTLHILDSSIALRRAYVTELVFERILMELQTQMFDHLQHLPHSFYVRARVGDLMARLSVDLGLVQQGMSAVVGRGLYLTLKAVLAGVALVSLSPLLGGFVLALIPLFAVAYAAGQQWTRRTSYELQHNVGQANALEQEYLTAHAEVKAFGLERRAVAAYQSRLLALLRVLLRLTLAGGLLEVCASLGTATGQVLVLSIGGYLVMTGHLTVGTLLASVGLLAAVFAPIAALANVGQTVQRASGGMDRLMEVLEEPLTIHDSRTATPLPRLAREIRFEGVTFGYQPERPVLRDLNLTIPAGTHVAIVGPSGSGKTTLANLLLRFWDPQDGRVAVDGRDVRDATLSSLRGQLGLVFQDTFIFDASVRDNIALSRPEATDTEVHAAAVAARLDAYVEALPDGFDTLLGERGVRMSGGQRQRLALARAVLRDPQVLILDEATSALDMRTEREVLDALAEFGPGRTRISITHRLALAATADQIVVLDHGRIVQQGTHAELARAEGLYQRLYAEQAARLDEHSGLQRQGDRFRARLDPELRQNAADVELDGRVANDQAVGDLRVSETLDHQLEYVALASAEVVAGRGSPVGLLDKDL